MARRASLSTFFASASWDSLAGLCELRGGDCYLAKYVKELTHFI